MPFGVHPVCKLCSSSESEMWHKTEDGQVQCNKCTVEPKTEATEAAKDSNDNKSVNDNEQQAKPTNGKSSAKPMMALRKSARCKAKVKTSVQNKPHTVKGKSRRIIFKRNVVRSPSACATPTTMHSLFFKGQYYQVGDIVSMVDVDGGTYYAQITGFLQDQFCEKSATVTWLLPTQKSSTDCFDPATYFLGPEEDIPRKLECMEFVCHAPSDYFKSASSPYPTLPEKPERGFIWTQLGPKIVYADQSDSNHSDDVDFSI